MIAKWHTKRLQVRVPAMVNFIVCTKIKLRNVNETSIDHFHLSHMLGHNFTQTSPLRHLEERVLTPCEDPWNFQSTKLVSRKFVPETNKPGL